MLARDYNPRHRISTATGLVNVGGFCGAVVMVFAVGQILDLIEPGAATHTAQAYRWAFGAIALLTAFGITRMVTWILRTRAHDNSDGVIVSTPTGSTAYSMSAGGPMILQKSLVFLIVSVNSLDNTRRPLVIPNDSILEIADITSRYHCEMVLDGGRRMQIKNTLECRKHEFPARLVRLPGDSSAASLMYRGESFDLSRNIALSDI